jgi:hypothetical protein
MSRQSRAMSSAVRQLCHLAIDTCAGVMAPAILQAPELQRQQLHGGDAARHFGQPDLDRWFCASGRPNSVHPAAV